MPIANARYYRTLLICPTRSMLHEVSPLLTQALPTAPLQEITSYPQKRQLAELLATSDAKVCLLECPLRKPEALNVLEDLHALAPQLPVVALVSTNDPEHVLRCMRQGATDFLIQPFTAEQVDAVLEKIARLVGPSARGAVAGKTLAVVPARGASGASTVACNLALQCKRLGAKKVLLADLDILTGTVSFLLKLPGGHSVLDVLQRADTLDADLWKQLTTTSQGIDALLAPENVLDPTAEIPSATPILEFVQETYEAAALDLASAYGSWNLSALRCADEILLVTTNEMPALEGAIRTLSYLEQNQVDTGSVKLILNRYIKDAGLRPENVQESVGLEPYQILPNDPDAIQRSIMEGKAVAANTPLGKAYAAMAERLVSFAPAKDDKKAAAAAKSGLFASLFSR